MWCSLNTTPSEAGFVTGAKMMIILRVDTEQRYDVCGYHVHAVTYHCLLM